MKPRYRLVFPRTSTKNGEEKTFWERCGVIFQKEGKFKLKLDMIPVGFDGWLEVVEFDDKKEN